MDGATALKFVRSRHSPEDGGDFNRARRQQLFLESVRDKVLSIGFLPKISPLMEDLEDSIRTDISPELMQKLLKESPQIKNYKIQQIVLTTDNYLKHSISSDGQYILVSNDPSGDWDAFQNDLKLYFKGVTPTPQLLISPTSQVVRKQRVQ